MRSGRGWRTLQTIWSLAMPRPPEQFLHHRVLRRGPYHVAAHGPEIDDVADEEDVVGGVMAQEFKQTVGLARTRAKVDVGEKDRTDRRHAAHLAAGSFQFGVISVTFLIESKRRNLLSSLHTIG